MTQQRTFSSVALGAALTTSLAVAAWVSWPSAAQSAATGPAVGMSYLSVDDPMERRDLDGWIWYPTASDAPEKVVMGNPVWAGVHGLEDAEPEPGQYPLVLVSHGMYGNIRNQAWLGRALAQQGYLVAAVNHPGSTTRDRRPDESRRLWERPSDLSRLLDALLADPVWGAHVDTSRIAAAGHSLGGLTVMRIAGAVGDNLRYLESCQASPEAVDCSAFAQLNIGHESDTDALAASNRDPRIKAVVSMDLGGTQTLSAPSVQDIDIPVLVMGAPRGKQLDQARESLALEALLAPQLLTSFHVEDTGHFDFLGVCTDRGLAILLDEEPDDAMVCEKGTTARTEKHAKFVGAIHEFLSARLN